jgi:hypothetical protein
LIFDIFRPVSLFGFDRVFLFPFKAFPLGLGNIFGNCNQIGHGIHSENKRAAFIPTVEIACQTEIGVTPYQHLFEDTR